LYPTGAADGAFVDWVFLNGTKSAPVVGLTTATVTFTAPSTPGSYEVRLLANNPFQRLGTTPTVTVVNDTTPPAVWITAPAAGATVSGMVTVTASTAADVAIVGVQFKVDGVNLGPELTTAPYSLPW